MINFALRKDGEFPLINRVCRASVATPVLQCTGTRKVGAGYPEPILQSWPFFRPRFSQNMGSAGDFYHDVISRHFVRMLPSKVVFLDN
jgi:hypothetical protein